MPTDSLSSRRVVVMGLGRFGGGVGVTRYLVARGARVLVTDLASADQLHQSIEQINDLPVDLRLGEHRISDFAEADLVVVNPAVDPRQNPFIAAARNANVPCTTEMRLLTQSLPNRDHTIGVTGTAGKSTVVAMIGHMLKRHLAPERVHVGGNIGDSLLGQLDNIKQKDWVVLELSSFMLEDLADDRWSPHVAVVTNIFPNHLDRYGTIDDYTDAKRAILDYQSPDDVAILDDTVAAWPTAANRIVLRAVADRALLIPGDHNQRNAALAELACSHVVGARTDLTRSLDDFPGLPHRLQFVADCSGVRCFNDSKSTTPQAAMLAIDCFEQDVVHVILGGYDKGADLRELAQHAASQCRAIYTIGATGSAIADAAGAQAVRCSTLDAAVTKAISCARPGDVLLLSPGCASWGQFDNFEQRGEAFVEALRTHLTDDA